MADDGIRIVGTIRTIELHTLAGKFKDVTTRQVTKIALEIERVTDQDGEELDVDTLAGIHFQGPAELVPRFSPGDRVQILTGPDSGFHIVSIKSAPVS